MRRLGQTESKGISKIALYIWGLVFALAGIVSRSILQNGFLQMNILTAEQLLDKLSASSTNMVLASVAILLQAVETCAIPLFAYLVVKGFEQEEGRKKQFLYLLAAAAVSELPYNLAIHGQVLHTATRNPVVALVIGFAVLYFFHRLQENTFANVVIKIFVGVSAVLWAIMLNVEHGLPILVVMITMRALREKKSMAILFGGVVASGCVVFSPLYIGAALGVLPVYFYREEEAEGIALPLYAIYPVLLAVCGIISIVL